MEIYVLLCIYQCVLQSNITASRKQRKTKLTEIAVFLAFKEYKCRPHSSLIFLHSFTWGAH